ncbi:MAG: HEAT repeat domain-containing protein, partial [Bacteroidota bacterium]
DGSDTGWRINWQYGKYTDPNNNSYKVWMDEGMHLPRHDGQAAYFLPAIQNFINGPTGLVYNPGTCLGPEWAGHFFMSEFRGGPSNSHLHTFTMQPNGAGFKLGYAKEILGGLLPTGLDFGPDGALYFGDWINGWGAKGKGKIWRLDGGDAGAMEAERQGVATLLQRDFSEISTGELKDLLAHADQRIRRKAQFMLANSGKTGARIFLEVASGNGPELARIHAIWGLAQQVRYGVTDGQVLLPLLTALEPEIIAQTAKMIGDQRIPGGEAQLIDLLQHRNPRVQFFATEALGRLRHGPAINPIIALLRENDDKDVYLRQAGMIALGRIGNADALGKLSNDPSSAVRIAAVVALRRMRAAQTANFLSDRDPYIVAEAARAIHDDFSIEAAMPKLAELLSREGITNEVVLRRAISANFRLGTDKEAGELFDYARRQDAPPAMGAEALAALATGG